MEKDYPKKGKPSDGEERGFNREDAGRNDDKPFAAFAKDKRKRITRIEKTEPRRKEETQGEKPPHSDFNREDGFRPERPDRQERPERFDRENRDGGDNRNRDDRPKRREDQPRKPYSGSGERHSYNPNFTKDNKLRKDGYSDRDNRDYRNDRSDRSDRGGRYEPSGSDSRGSRYRSDSDDRTNRYGQRDYNRTDEPGQRDFNRVDDPRDFNRTGGGRSDRNERNDRNDRYDRGGRSDRGVRGPYGDREGRPSKYNPLGGKPRFDKPQGGYGKPQGGYDKPQGGYGKSQGGYDKPQGGYGKSQGGYDKPQGGYDRPRRDKPQTDRGAKQTSRTQTQGRFKDGSYPTFPAPAIEDEIRLNRYIAAAGKSSRREADDLIREGRVTVNNQVVTEMGSKIKAGDIVQVDGETIRSEKKVYILMNKPKGFVTTLEDPFAEKTVMDLLRNACAERVYPVGRLDKNSLGVLLVTNDGDLTTNLTHPSFNKKKIYQVTLDKPLTRADMEQIVEGIALEDGEIHADEINYVDETKREIGIEIHSGRNRVVRRIFEHLGYRVTKLDRVYFAGLTKKNLKRGQWRFLTPKEVDILKSGRYE